MEDASSSSKPAPLDVIEIPPTAPSTAVWGECHICHSFERLSGFFLHATYAWTDVVTSAHGCTYCDAIIRGCRGWLDEDRKRDWTPENLLLYFGDSQNQATSVNISARPYPDERHSYHRDAWKLGGYSKKWGHYYVEMSFASTTIRLKILAAQCESLRDIPARQDWKHFGQPLPEPWSYLQRVRPRTPFTGSKDAFKIANTWLRNCVENHAACRIEKGQALPTRLLDLRSPDNEEIIKLVENIDGDVRYAALSHCWGVIKQFTTTKATLPERHEHIRLKDMTKTFSEAVQVVRELGIRYLWVRK